MRVPIRYRLVHALLTFGYLVDGAAQGIAHAYLSDPRHALSPSPARADAHANGPRHDLSDGEGADDGDAESEDVDPRSFSIFIFRENEDAEGGLDRYGLSMTAPPALVKLPEREYLAKVMASVEQAANQMDQAEAEAEQEMGGD